MTTSPGSSVARHPAAGRRPLRIRLDNGFRSDPLDGAWWPQSHDLQEEAADLVDHLPGLLGRVERLLFSRPDWDAVGGVRGLHRIEAGCGSIRVGSFPAHDTHVMVVKMLSGERIRLLVVPSETEEGVAITTMEAAADDRNTETAAALLRVARPDPGSNAPK